MTDEKLFKKKFHSKPLNSDSRQVTSVSALSQEPFI